jgi:hypothetical protein
VYEQPRQLLQQAALLKLLVDVLADAAGRLLLLLEQRRTPGS